MNHHGDGVQNEEPNFKGPKIEGPNFEGAKNEEPKNQGPTPNEKDRPFVQVNQAAVFQLLQELDASDFKVFFFLTIRAYGWEEKTRRVGDGITRASGTFVAKGTGLSEATSEKCINTLKQKGLISKFHHSCKWGNTYQVKPTLLRQGSNEIESLEDNKKHRKTKEPKPEEPKEPANPKVSKPEPIQREEPKNEGPKIEVPKNHHPSTLGNRPLGAQNLGTNIDSRYLDLSLKLSLTEIFENYFSKIRAPMTEKKERDCWAQIQNKNPDVTSEEFLECFKHVSETKDSKGNPICMKFLWMANGFDTILMDARQRIRSKHRREEEQKKAEKAAQEEAILEQQTSPEDARLAKEAIRALLGSSFLKPLNPPQHQQQSEQERRTFLLSQAKQIQQIEKFGNL